MKVFYNKEDIISYQQLNKIGKKSRNAPKLGQNWAEICQNWKKVVKNWYYVQFETKNFTKQYKIRVFQNAKDMISYYQQKKYGKKRGHS